MKETLRLQQRWWPCVFFVYSHAESFIDLSLVLTGATTSTCRLWLSLYMKFRISSLARASLVIFWRIMDALLQRNIMVASYACDGMSVELSVSNFLFASSTRRVTPKVNNSSETPHIEIVIPLFRKKNVPIVSALTSKTQSTIWRPVVTTSSHGRDA